jgi:hypothetical protein
MGECIFEPQKARDPGKPSYIVCDTIVGACGGNDGSVI